MTFAFGCESPSFARARARAVRVSNEWFRALMDSAPEIYFRYAFAPARRFAYVSRAVEPLTAYTADAFYADPAFCVSLIPREDRPVLRQIVRARRPLICTLRLRCRDGRVVRVGIRTVPVIRDRKLVAVEGIAVSTGGGFAQVASNAASEPVQQRLAALLYEVHDILHRTLPPRETAAATERRPSA